MAQEKGLPAAFQYFAAPDAAFIVTDPRKNLGETSTLHSR